jgi:hypothetical protein
VKDLAKLDLDPNTVYNVSLSVTQGTKKFDNLRFFQSKTPKLFNIIPGEYSTFSRLITALEPVIPVIGGGVYDPAKLVSINITNVSWQTVYAYDVSEGESYVNIDGSYVDFIIRTASDPGTFVFKIDGFGSKFACLNNRSDWDKVNGTTYKVRTSLREFDPGAQETNNYTKKETSTHKAKVKTKVGQSLIFLKTRPTSVAKNLSEPKAFVGSGKQEGPAFATNTRVTYVQKVVTDPTNYYVIVNPEIVREIPAEKNITFTSFTWNNDVIWSSGRAESGSESPDSLAPPNGAILQYYTSPSYSAIKTTYSFKGSSSVNSEILNSTVLDSLIWEKDIRDFIYFFISDTLELNSPYWYYFNNSSANGGINTKATLVEGSKIVGDVALSISSGTGEERVLNPPPDANSYITDPSQTSYPPQTLKARTKFYEISKTNKENDASQPQLEHAIGIRFAIARYTKGPTGTWSNKTWLGINNQMKNVLSQTEALS